MKEKMKVNSNDIIKIEAEKYEKSPAGETFLHTIFLFKKPLFRNK